MSEKNINTSKNSTTAYPTREEHNLAWEKLAREIANSNYTRSETPTPVEKNKRGALIILGSGIQGVGFTMEAEAYLKIADKVFYCVSNPPTQVWIHEQRPDAFDLYVLYDDTKPRYHTYMQMTDAMLHYVRKGKRVACVYYGHPGIFVLSTHRAIAIARREGHYAVMKPGISALDCLCADLGVDPAYPGMQTFEASEVLLRKRKLDTSIHVVLWQVGLIGEQGYRRKGFINDKFPILVKYLQEIYGEHYPVTHYVAARHATFEPTIAIHKLSEMLNPRVRSTFTGISTFYIAPKVAAQTDVHMAAQLGFEAKPGQKISKLKSTRNIAAYGKRELEAIEKFSNFQVPNEYQFQPDTRAGQFLLALTQDIALQDLYQSNPEQALSEASFPGLSKVERHLLASRDENHAHVAAKGSLVSFSPNEKFIIDLYMNIDLAKSYRSMLIENYRRENAIDVINDWMNTKGYNCSMEHYLQANTRLTESLLLPWTGVYATEDNSLVLTVVGSAELNDLSFVSVNLSEIKQFSFNNSALIWHAEDGNPNNGKLQFNLVNSENDEFKRTIVGEYWLDSDNKTDRSSIELAEVVPRFIPLSTWVGQYRTQCTKDGEHWIEGPIVTLTVDHHSDSQVQISIDGELIEEAKFQGNTVTWGDNSLSFAPDRSTTGGLKGRIIVSGKYGNGWPDGTNIKGYSTADYDVPYYGRYVASAFVKNRWNACHDLNYDGQTICIGGDIISEFNFEHNVLRWDKTDTGTTLHGELQFSFEPTTRLTNFIGYLWRSSGKPRHPNIQGCVALGGTVSSPEHIMRDTDLSEIQMSDQTLVPKASKVVLSDGDNGWLPERVNSVLSAIAMKRISPLSTSIWSRWQSALYVARLTNNLAPKIHAFIREREIESCE